MAIDIYQNRIKYLIVIAVLVSIALFFCPILNENLTIESIKKIGSYSVTVTTFFAFAFNVWLWKYLPESLSGRPNVSGTWKGTIEYRWANPDEKKDIRDTVDPIYICIKQTFLSTKICAFTVESDSHSLSSNIVQTDGGAWELSYTYDNTPDRRLRDRSQRHRGAAELKINRLNGEYTIEGDYWTDRWSQGHMFFSERHAEFATNYASSNQMFESIKEQL
jgi:hypothetical protein